MSDVVVAVDGGNSKTDLALVRSDGAVLSLVRGPLSSPHHLGVDGSIDVLESLFAEACSEAGLVRRNGPIAAVGQLCMAGVDFPSEEEELERRVSALQWATTTSVANDTYAVLWSGTRHGHGIGLVCGAGINCVALAPDGREVRFLALGGGVARSLDAEMLDELRARLREVGPRIELRPTQAPPVLGAALCALGTIGADGAAHERARKELAHG